MVFVFANQLLSAQNTNLDIMFNYLDTLSGEKFRNAVNIAFDSVSRIDNYDIRKKKLDILFNKTAKKDEISHIRSLVSKAIASDSLSAELFQKAFKLAEKHNRKDDMCFVEYTRGHYYIARKQYDSAMIHILHYRDMTPQSDKGEGYRNIINLLGDVYYHSGLYEQAKEIYYDQYLNYKEEKNWNFYRPYIMMNNLGQIALKKGNINEALHWFNRSLVTANTHLNAQYKNNTIAFIKIKTAEANIKQDSIVLADNILNEVSLIPKETIQDDVYQEYLFIKTQLLIKQKKLDDARKIALTLIPESSVKFESYRFIPDIYNLLSQIYYLQGDYQKSIKLNEKYNLLRDSIINQEHIAQSMIILANYNHELTRLNLSKSKQRNINLLMGLSLLTIALLVVMFLYRRLYKSKLDLVRKSIDLNTEMDFIDSNSIGKDKKGPIKAKETQKQKQLINDLKELMDKDKLFLDPKINLVETARLISSNRTYLSRAINNQLNTNFPNFVNEYRINESINLIKSGYTKIHTQDALARQSGFSSRTVFISAFKKYTGVVPSFFIANYKK